MYQGVSDFAWLNNKRYVVSWLRNPDGETVWEQIAPSNQEDKRVDLYDSVVSLLTEVKKRNITALTVIIGDHILYNHLVKEWVPRKTMYISRYNKVEHLLGDISEVKFASITTKEQIQAQKLVHELASDDDDDYNNPDLVMISFI